MSQESLIFFIGLLVFITPVLGIPNEWKVRVFMILGALLLILGYRLRRAAYLRSLETEKGERQGDAFVESHTLTEARRVGTELRT